MDSRKASIIASTNSAEICPGRRYTIPTNGAPVRMAERPKATSCVTTPTLTGCVFEKMNVRTANQLLVPCRAHIATARAKTRHDIGSDVLV